MPWAMKRKLVILGALALSVWLLGFFVIYPYFNKPPTCFDKKQNGDETGVDCGGSCTLACTFEADRLSVVWSRTFRVAEGRYNAVAYVENRNRDKAIEKINYKFRFADKDNVFISERIGSATIPPSGKFAIFEPAIDAGNTVPVYTNFEFIETPVWINVPQEKINQIKMTVSNVEFEESTDSPRLSASLRNTSLFEIEEVSVVAILYDITGNAINVSRTYMDSLPPEGIEEINFTWPEPFDRAVVAREIIPTYNIFQTKLK